MHNTIVDSSENCVESYITNQIKLFESSLNVA